MPITFTLPLLEDKHRSVKDMVFTILTTTYPLSLIELLNALKKQYAVSVSFQAVRKAALELVTANVLVKEGKTFSLNREWILEAVKFTQMLQRQYFNKAPQEKIKIAVGPNVTVYTFSRLVDLDAVWNSIIRDHFASDPAAPKHITFESLHFWFVIVTLAQETELMKEMIHKGIRLHYLCYGNTALDQWAVNHYNEIGVHCKQLPKPKDFVNGYNLGVYGNLIIKTTHPKVIADKMECFFRKYKKIENTRLAEITEIVTQQTELQLTVIKDQMLAQSIRNSVLSHF